MSIPLAWIEEIIDASGIAPRIEALLPAGARHRQLRVRTLLTGMMLSQADQRPAHLTRVRDALTALPADDQVRLGVIEDWKAGPHLLTYRQTERTFGLAADALAKDAPDGLPRLDTSRLRATWLADVAGLIGLATFMHAAGITCSQRLGDLLASLEPAGEQDAVRLLGADRRP